jgi:hypothetical protein
MHTMSLLLFPASILSETNSNLQILQDFIFKRNFDFISNSNVNQNHVESRSRASRIYRRSLVIVSHRFCDFFGEFEVNLTSLVSSPCRTLAARLYRSEIGGL